MMLQTLVYEFLFLVCSQLFWVYTKEWNCWIQVMLCLSFWATIKLVSTTAAPFHIPISNVLTVPMLINSSNVVSLHLCQHYFLFVFSLFLFASFCFSFCLVLVLVKAVLRGVEWYLFVVLICIFLMINRGFPGGLIVKNLPANAGVVGLISGSGKSSGEGNGNLLQYSCLGNPTDRRSLAAYLSIGSQKSWTPLNNRTITTWLMMLNIFLCACWPYVYLLWRHIIFKSFVHFKIRFGFIFLFLSYRSFNIFWILTPCHTCKYFPHCVGCLFTLFRVSFDALSFLFCWSPVYFFFSCLCFWCHSQEIKSSVMKLLSCVLRVL